jgi:hypothetical protein
VFRATTIAKGAYVVPVDQVGDRIAEEFHRPLLRILMSEGHGARPDLVLYFFRPLENRLKLGFRGLNPQIYIFLKKCLYRFCVWGRKQLSPGIGRLDGVSVVDHQLLPDAKS